MITNKLVYILLIATIAINLKATADTPSSPASMSDAIDAVPQNNKRKANGAIHQENAAEEENSRLGQKALRMSAVASSLPVTDSSHQPAASSSSTITNNNVALTAALPAPTALIKAKPQIPAWYYGSPMHEITFEHLDYADLTLARRTSKDFKTMAKQVIMPTGQKWVAWFKNKFKNVNSAHKEYHAFKDIIAAAARCPNPIEKLREIVRNYYTNVPAALRFWNAGHELPEISARVRLNQIISTKDNLRHALGNVMDQIAKLEAEQAQARQAMEQHDQPAVVAKELATLKEQQQKIIAPLKDQQQKIMDLLRPCLYALAPYTTANIILSELGGKEFPEILPILLENDRLDPQWLLRRLAKKISPQRGYIETLVAGCIPSIHASLAAQHDSISRPAKLKIESLLTASISPSHVDNSCMPNELIAYAMNDLEYYYLRITQLRQAIAWAILKDKEISELDLQKALWNIEEGRNKFLFDRIQFYLADQNKALLQNEILTKHVTELIIAACKTARPSELQDCRAIAAAAFGPWSPFILTLKPKERHTILWEKAYRQTVASFAERAVILAADTLTANDLRRAIVLCHYASQLYKVATFQDQLLNEFGGEVSVVDYFNASHTHAQLASINLKSNNQEIAKRHYDAATKYLERAQQLGREASLERLKNNSSSINRLGEQFSDMAAKNPQIAELATKATEFIATFNERINELEAAANPQPI